MVNSKLLKVSRLFAFLALSIPMFASTPFAGYCEVGGGTVTTAAIISSTFVQGSFPGCTVFVKNPDGSSAIIFADNSGTPKANPFTADSLTGYWTFFANSNTLYAQLSGAGIPSPFTVLALNSGGSIGPSVLETNFLGADCGARINAAYLSLPATGGEILVPEICSFSTPILFSTANKAAILRAYGNATIMTYTGTTGTAITFNNGRPFDFTSAIRNLTLTGPGNSTSTVGVLLGGSNGAVGFSADHFKFQSFGTVVQTSSNTWVTKFDHGMIRDGAILFLEPSGQTQAGENVELDHVVFADAPVPHTNAVWIQGGGQETIFSACSFDQAQLHIGNGSTSAAQIAVIGSHFENPNAASGGVDYPFVVMDNNNGNFLRFTDDFIEQDRLTGSPYTSFLNLLGGVANITGVGIFTPVQLTSFATLGNAVNVNLFGFNDLSGQTVSLYGGSTTGYIQSLPGTNTANSTGFNMILGAGDLFGPAASSIIQDLAVGTASHNHTLTVNGSEQINTGNLNISGGVLQMGGSTAIDSSRNGTFLTGTFNNLFGVPTVTIAGVSTTLNKPLVLKDESTSDAPGINLLDHNGVNIGTWITSPAASFQVVNSSGLNDFVVFQNGGPRFPHVATGTSGGTQACWDSSFNLSSGSCGGGGGGGTPGSPVSSVQFNLAGGFAGNSVFEWNNTSGLLSVCPTVGGICNGASGITAQNGTFVTLNVGIGSPFTVDASGNASGLTGSFTCNGCTAVTGSGTTSGGIGVLGQTDFGIGISASASSGIALKVSGPGTPTANGTVQIVDGVNNSPTIEFLNSGGRIANWGASAAASVQIVNSSGTNDFVIFQNAGPRFPHVATGTTGGTQACFDGLLNLSSGVCNTNNTVFCVGGGSVNSITCPGVPAGLVAYSTGLTINLLASEGTNTGATTININSLGAKNVFNAGAPMTGGEIVNGNAYVLVYDGTQFNKTSTGGGVTSINTSLTGNVTNVAILNTAETFTALQQFLGTGTSTTGIVDINDTGTTATGIRILEASSRIANWNAGPTFSFEVVNSSSTNDLVVFQNGTVRIPHVTTGGSGGTQACFNGSFDLYSGTCGSGSGTVTSVSFTGGLISVATATTTPALSVTGTSGGIPYFSSGSTWASSAALTAHGVVLGEGPGAAPVATSAGTAGQVLTSNGASANPTFQAPAAAGVSAINTTLTGNVTNVALLNVINSWPSAQVFNGSVSANSGLVIAGTGSSTTGILSIEDGSTTPGLSLYSSGGGTKQATWSASSATSLQVVNSSNTNDFIVFQTGTIRVPHITASGSGGVGVCVDSSGNFYKAPC